MYYSNKWYFLFNCVVQTIFPLRPFRLWRFENRFKTIFFSLSFSLYFCFMPWLNCCNCIRLVFFPLNNFDLSSYFIFGNILIYRFIFTFFLCFQCMVTFVLKIFFSRILTLCSDFDYNQKTQINDDKIFFWQLNMLSHFEKNKKNEKTKIKKKKQK